MQFITISNGIYKKKENLEKLLDGPVVKSFFLSKSDNFASIIGWGAKRNTICAKKMAAWKNIPYISLEDGFLRSFGPGKNFPQLSLIKDFTGIYYDSTRPSDLENLFNSDSNLLINISEIEKARNLILNHKLSKYNNSSGTVEYPINKEHNILVVDQTMGDMSVQLGGASKDTFREMLEAARDENPSSQIWIKTHPEVSFGEKEGYLSRIRNDSHLKVLKKLVNPIDLINKMDKVYVVSSTMGFEAILAGKDVTCFGIPWYSGWGVTDDRKKCPRRLKIRSSEELFYGAYFHYTTYLNPKNHKIGNIFDVIEWLILQKKISSKLSGIYE